MEVGHSRLLKLLLPDDRSRMSEHHKIRIEYINPTSIQCEVPGHQELRDVSHSHINDKQEQGLAKNDEIEATEDEATYSPVITVTKEKAVFTKGDLKLQKVSVTENISEPKDSMSYKVTNPLYSEVQSEVIQGPQPIRQATYYVQNGDQEEKKPKSRIPKFRQEVEKLRQKRKQSVEMKEQEVPSNQPRRSSIPRLRRTRLPSVTKDTNENHPKDNQKTEDTTQRRNSNQLLDNNHEGQPPEDEFDKIFGEILHDENEQDNIDTKFVDKVTIKDAETLEHSFEEIIHDYEENKVQPIDLKPVRSRIPLVKQKSLPEEQLVKKFVRKMSLKDISTDDDNKIQTIKDSETIDKMKDEQKPANKDVKNYVTKVPKYTKETTLKKSLENLADKYKNEDIISKTSTIYDRSTTTSEETVINRPNLKEKSQLDSTTFKSQIAYEKPLIKETIKVATPVFNKTVDTVASENNILTTADTDQATLHNKDKQQDAIVKSKYTKTNNNYVTTPATSTTDLISQSEQTPGPDRGRDKYTSMIKSKKESLIEDMASSDKKEKIRQTNEKEKNKIIAKGKVSLFLNKIESNDQSSAFSRQFSTEIPKRHSILSKIAAFSRDKNGKSIIVPNIQVSASINKPITGSQDEIDNIFGPTQIETSSLSTNIRKNSIEKLKYARSKSVPIDVISKIKHNTPPNTPQSETHEYYANDITSEVFVNDTNNNTFNFNTNSYNKKVSRDNALKTTATPESFTNIAATLEEKREPKIDSFNDEIIRENIIEPCRDLVVTTEADQANNQDINNNAEAYNFDAVYPTQETASITKQDNIIKNDDDYVNKDKTSQTSSVYENTTLAETLVKNTTIADNLAKENIPFQADKTVKAEKGKLILEEDMNLKGKVNRTINKLHSVDESISKKELIEIPIKKSVLSRIAMFEHQTKETEPKFNKKTKPITNLKPLPRIIDQVLKPQPRPNPLVVGDIGNEKPVTNVDRDRQLQETNDNIHSYTIDKSKEEKIAEVKENNDSVYQEIIIDDSAASHEAKVIYIVGTNNENVPENFSHKINDDFVTDTNNSDKNINEAVNAVPNFMDVEKAQESQTKFRNDFDDTEKYDKNIIFKEEPSELSKMEERLKRMHIRNEENLKKAKSVVELELVKGKVREIHQMIVRLNSVEKLDLEKKNNVINDKERPRKKSVSEKIALFEKKLILQEMEPAQKPAAAATGVTEAPQATETDYTAIIEDLKSAKDKYGTDEDMVYVTLRNGGKMPVVALGTALLDPVLLPHVVGAAINLGFRAIDTAYIYGNEAAVGEAIRAKIDDGTVKREDLFIIGKLWSTSHRRDLVEGACRSSLAALQLEYFDLYLIHNPMSFKEGPDPFPKIANVLQYSDIDYLDAWFGMEDLVSKGLAKSIGVSNFNSEQIARVMEKGRIKPVVNQVECHPYLNQLRLDEFCGDRDVRLMCYGALGSKGTPDELRHSKAAVIDDPLVKVMAAGLGVTPAQLLIRYQIESGHAVVAKSSNPHHLKDILKAMHINITSSEVDALDALNSNKRTYNFKGMGDTHKNYPFKIPF